jgi:hypothetical protein
VGNRDWNRIEAELQAGLPRNREPGRCRQHVQSRNASILSKIDSESILKHIEEALRENDDRV